MAVSHPLSALRSSPPAIRWGLAALLLIVLRWAITLPAVPLDEALATAAWQAPHQWRWPVCFVLLGFVVVGWAHYEATRSGRGKPWPRWCRALLDSPVVFGILTLAAMVCICWRTLPGFEFDVDEGQSILAARVLWTDARFWVSTDVGTHGPVVSLCQAILPYLGFKIDYAGSRLLGVAMLWASLLFGVYPLYRRVVVRPLARLLAVTGIFFVVSIRDFGMSAYNGEHPIVFFCALAGGLAATALLCPREESEEKEASAAPSWNRTRLALFASGFCAGTVPWAKLQGVPIAATIFLITVIACYRTLPRGSERRAGHARLLVYLVGAIMPTLLVLVWAGAGGALPLMVRSYIQWNLVYAARYNDATRGFAGIVREWFGIHWITLSRMMDPLNTLTVLGGVLLLGMLFTRIRVRRELPHGGELFLALLLVTVAVWFCVLRPGNRYTHYLVLTFLPTLLVPGLLWAMLLRASEPSGAQTEKGPAFLRLRRAVPGLLAASYLLLGILGPFYDWAFVFHPNEPPEDSMRFTYAATEWREAPDPRLCRAALRPGDRMAVWGWGPSLYVLADALPAPRSTAGPRESFRDAAMQPYFFDLYLRDFDQHAPAVFVDEVGIRSISWVQYKEIEKRLGRKIEPEGWKRLQHEAYSPLAARIRRDYVLLYAPPLQPRLYVRRDRMTSELQKLARTLEAEQKQKHVWEIPIAELRKLSQPDEGL